MSAGPREQTTEPARDVVAAIREHAQVWENPPQSTIRCRCGWSGYQHSEHVAEAVTRVLGLTEERRTLTDGWIQPFRNAGYISQGLKPPPAVITHECRWVSGWSVVGEA